MKMLAFTDLENGTVYLSPTWIQGVSAPLSGEHGPEAKAVISLSGMVIAVKEEPFAIVLKLEGSDV